MKSNSELIAIRKGLSRFAMKWKPSSWLNTGIADLNNVMGHRNRGLAYGRIIEVSGFESNGKSAIMLTIAALAQRDGAHVIWGDIENSFEPDWALQRGMVKCPDCKGTTTITCHCATQDDKPKDKKTGKKVKAAEPEEVCHFCKGTQLVECPTCEGCGMDESRITLIQPYVGLFGKEKEPRLSTAEELLSEIEMCMSIKRPEDKCVVVLDSIAALLTERESNDGIEGANMRTKMDLPMLMSSLLRRWVGKAQIHNAMIILINQLRSSPGKYGDPNYTPGGNAPRFYSHVRVRVKRTPGSKIIEKGKTIGIKGTITATKNKTGGEEGSKVGFRLFYRKSIEFVPAKDVLPEKTESD